MPCLRTLSRSTSAKYCGVLGSSVVKRSANSGRLPRGGQELLRVLGQERGIATGAILQHERDAGDVPMPGMAGGENANACASATPARRWFSRWMITSAVRPCLLRSSQSSSVMK